jgi:hypothetical protein
VVIVLILLGISLLLYAVGEANLLKSAVAFAMSAILLIRAFVMRRANG